LTEFKVSPIVLAGPGLMIWEWDIAGLKEGVAAHPTVVSKCKCMIKLSLY